MLAQKAADHPTRPVAAGAAGDGRSARRSRVMRGNACTNLVYVYDVCNRATKSLEEFQWARQRLKDLRKLPLILLDLFSREEEPLKKDMRNRVRKRSSELDGRVRELSRWINRDCRILAAVASQILGMSTLPLRQAQARIRDRDKSAFDEQMVRSTVSIVEEIRLQVLSLYDEVVAEAQHALASGEHAPGAPAHLAHEPHGGTGGPNGELTVKREARTILYGGTPLRINQHAHFAVLASLIEADYGIVEHADLLRAIKPKGIASGVRLSEAPPDVKDAVKAINRAMADMPFTIRAVRGRGYQLRRQ